MAGEGLDAVLIPMLMPNWILDNFNVMATGLTVVPIRALIRRVPEYVKKRFGQRNLFSPITDLRQVAMLDGDVYPRSAHSCPTSGFDMKVRGE